MLLVGALSIGNDNYLVQCVYNKVNERWTLFDYRTEEDRGRVMFGEEPQDRILEWKDISSLRDNQSKYVVCSVVQGKSGKISKRYGNQKVLITFLEILNKANMLRDGEGGWELVEDFSGEGVLNYTLEKGNEFVQIVKDSDGLISVNMKYGVVTFETLLNNAKTKKVKEYLGLEYADLEWIKKDRISSGLKVLNSKSLAELIEQLDLSWYIDGTGRILKDYKCVGSMQELREEIGDADRYEMWAMDTETTGLKICSLPSGHEGKDHVVGMSLSWRRDQGIYIPFDHTEFENLDKREVLNYLKEYLESKKILCHNGLFDCKVMFEEGIELNLFGDTMLLEFSIGSRVYGRSLGLNNLTMELYGHRTIELVDIFGKKSDAGLFRNLRKDLATVYACADTDYVLQMYLDRYPVLPNECKKTYELDVLLAKTLKMSEYVGFKVDLNLLEILNEVNDRDLATLEELIYKYVGQVGWYTQATLDMDNKVKSGKVTKEEAEEYLNRLTNSDAFKNAKRTFRIRASSELNEVIYEILNYPIIRVGEKTGLPSTDVNTITDFLKEDTSEHNTWLSEDVMSSIMEYDLDWVEERNSVLINHEEFRMKKYPFILLLKQWRKLDKLKTSFFANLLGDNTDGMYYSGYRLTSAATARVINPVQTLIGHLKKLIVPYNNDYYMLVFDFSQFEYRLMAGLAGDEAIIGKMNHPEKDYHREGGAAVVNTTPEDMTKAERDNLKAVHFAVPYGMQEYSLGMNLANKRKEKFTRAHVEEAMILLDKWKKSNVPIYGLLEAYRKFAVEKRYIENRFQRRRLFKVGELTNKEIGRIKRQAGNYPIQSLQRDIFVVAYINLCRRLEKEGLKDKFFIPGLVHDEMCCIVHKSVHPYFAYKMIKEECMIEMAGFPNFFASVNVVDNWYEGKEDLYEAPILFMNERIKDYEEGKYDEVTWLDDPKTYVLNDIIEYMSKRLLEEVFRLQPDLTKDNFDAENFVERFKDYFLKPRLFMYVKANRKADKKREDLGVLARIETLLSAYWKEDFKYEYKGETYEVKYEDENEIFLGDIVISDNDNMMIIEDEFMEEAEEETEEALEISIPIGNYKPEDDFEIKDTLTVGDKRNIWDLVDFKAKKEVFKASEVGSMIVRNDELIINVKGVKTDKFKELVAYMKSCQDEKGLRLKFRLDEKIIDSGFSVSNYSLELVGNLIDKKFFKALINQ